MGVLVSMADIQALTFDQVVGRPNADLTTKQIALLLRSALPEFYGAIPLEADQVDALIVGQMSIKESECFNPLVVLRGEKALAAASLFPSKSLPMRQSSSTAEIVRALDREGRKAFLRAISGVTIQPIPDVDALYIGRIAVAADARRQGHGERLIDHIRSQAPGQPILLHVDRQNPGAISFYQRVGFEFISASDHQKRAMMLPGPTAPQFQP